MKKIILIYFFLSLVLYAAPKDDFANVLNLAKFSSCEDIAYKFDTLSKFDGFGKLVEKELDIKKENLFPWRAVITNGYKEGFFYYALLGYANEISGDIPYAYQCYQNVTLYIDEEKSFNFPEPTAEIYLGIARTCLAVGRYMDAKDWLDATYEYANNNPKIMAAIDRVAIQRGNELGDYENIILHYRHLEKVSRASKCEQSPPFKGDLGGCKLTKPELANYAQILFYSRKDRVGFSKLLEGISKLGIDNNLSVKDILVDKFLNNIMRADNEEIEYFYDLLGYEIEAARAKAGDENYLAFLCNARTLFCKVYYFLDPEDDLKKVKKRIDKVKEQLKQGYDVFGKNPKSMVRNPWSKKKKKISKSQNRKISKSGDAEELPEVELENLLMRADWQFKNKSFSKALTNYLMASESASGSFANLEYDGTTTKNATIMGLSSSELQLNSKLKIHNSQFDFDSSFRAAELSLQFCQKATNDEQRTRYDIETAITLLPQAHPKVLNYLRNKARKFAYYNNFESALNFFKEYDKKTTYIKDRYAFNHCSCAIALFAIGKEHEAFSYLLKTLKYSDKQDKRDMIFEILDKMWSFAAPEDIEKYPELKKISMGVKCLLKKYELISYRQLVIAKNWMKKTGNNQLKLLTAIENYNTNKAITILTNQFKESTQFGHQKLLAEFLSLQGKTNESNKIFSGIKSSKNKLIKKYK